jgi:hypothetical protein
VNGRAYTQTLRVTMDPRVQTGTDDLQLQHDLSYRCYTDIMTCMKETEKMRLAQKQLQAIHTGDNFDLGKKVSSIITRVNELLSGNESFAAVSGKLHAVLGNLQGGDFAPTSQCTSAARAAHKELDKNLKNKDELVNDIADINKQLKK